MLTLVWKEPVLPRHEGKVKVVQRFPCLSEARGGVLCIVEPQGKARNGRFCLTGCPQDIAPIMFEHFGSNSVSMSTRDQDEGSIEWWESLPEQSGPWWLELQRQTDTSISYRENSLYLASRVAWESWHGYPSDVSQESLKCDRTQYDEREDSWDQAVDTVQSKIK